MISANRGVAQALSQKCVVCKSEDMTASCGRCGNDHYCGIVCQRAHLPKHLPQCEASATAKAELIARGVSADYFILKDLWFAKNAEKFFYMLKVIIKDSVRYATIDENVLIVGACYQNQGFMVSTYGVLPMEELPITPGFTKMASTAIPVWNQLKAKSIQSKPFCRIFLMIDIQCANGQNTRHHVADGIQSEDDLPVGVSDKTYADYIRSINNDEDTMVV